MLTYAQQLQSNYLEKLAAQMLFADDKRKTLKLPSKSVKQYQTGCTYILKVPYSKKNQAKALGAKWDYETKTWQCPGNLDAGIFHKFSPVLLTQELEEHVKSKMPKPVLRYKKMKTTGVLAKTCNCTVPPWEDCEHTIQVGTK
jgi:Domain of unknown function (DUF5710)